MKQKVFGFFILFFSASFLMGLEVATYGVAETPWSEHYGNHRAVVEVERDGAFVGVEIPWRLRFSPAMKALYVVEASTGERVKKFARRNVSKEKGFVSFEAGKAGIYYVYYLPYKTDETWAGFKGRYAPRNISTLVRAKAFLEKAVLVRLEARTLLDSFYPMAVCPTSVEKREFLWENRDKDYLVFVEPRKNQIRMKSELPYKWIESGEVLSLKDDLARNEWYPIQVGVYANQSTIENVRFEYGDLKSESGDLILGSQLSCLNTHGVDYLGNDFVKRVDVPHGKVQPLWVGVDLPVDVQPGVYRGEIQILSDNYEARTVHIELNVTSQELVDRGDNDLWRLSRLRWLNSRIGLDDSEMIAPFEAVALLKMKSDGVFEFKILNRQVTIGKRGLPSSIKVKGQEILTEEISLGPIFKDLVVDKIELIKQEAFAVQWRWSGKTAELAVEGRGSLEADGYMDYAIEVTALSSRVDGDVKLEIPMAIEVADYILGFDAVGKGRECPRSIRAKWMGPRDSFWVGSVDAGIYVEMQGASYTGPLLNLYNPEYPASWHNRGKGSYGLRREGNQVLVDVSSGKRSLRENEKVLYDFALIVTPVKEIDWKNHFNERYYHMTPLKEFEIYDYGKKGESTTVSIDLLTANDPMPVDDDLAYGLNVINVHHAHAVNPYINYPFATPDRIKTFVDKAHEKELEVKLYYTVRELSNATYEMWALRSLGDEIFPYGNGGGYVWLQEHLEDDYQTAWYSHNGPVDNPDAAIVTSGITRWYNYYVEGLRWMVKNYGIDGVYLDDVAFDRTILKRMRRVMEDVKPDCSIDLHSNTGFSKGPALQYTEFFPYIDRLWFGESFHYNSMSAVEMLTEVSGIPFGLTGDMLFGGGNPWRGLIMGMTSRYPWYTDYIVSDPRGIYALLDSINIKEDVELFPFWEEAPVATFSSSDVKATVYKGASGKDFLVALASFATFPVEGRLSLDWERLGISEETVVVTRATVGALQEGGSFDLNQPFKVNPKEGLILQITVK